jgi:hypothetical protein
MKSHFTGVKVVLLPVSRPNVLARLDVVQCALLLVS